MNAETRGYRNRITLDRNTLIIDRICAVHGSGLEEPAGALVEELDGRAGLLHAIVSWLRPKNICLDNPITVNHGRRGLPQSKSRYERIAARRARGSR